MSLMLNLNNQSQLSLELNAQIYPHDIGSNPMLHVIICLGLLKKLIVNEIIYYISDSSSISIKLLPRNTRENFVSDHVYKQN